MLSPDEKLVLEYLKPLGKQYATAKEVCRRAGGKTKFAENPDWAKPILKRMEKKGLLETDAQGHYRINRSTEESPAKEIPMDPRIRQILMKSGKDFSKVFLLEDPDHPGRGGKGK